MKDKKQLRQAVKFTLFSVSAGVIQAGIKRVVYGEKYRLTDGIDLLERAGVVVEYLPIEE